jgi:succinoglycan biosynthesis transport protein ExoP
MSDSTEVKLHFLDYWRVIKARAGIIILTFLLTMITAGVTVYFLPREFYSEATIEVKPDTNKLGVFSGSDFTGEGGDPQLAPTQLQILQEKEILYPVIEQMGLMTKWANGGAPIPEFQAYGRLQGMLEVTPDRNTNLIRIGVWSVDSKEAKDLANSIAVVYADRRVKLQKDMLDASLMELKNELFDREKNVEVLGAAAAKIRLDQGIVDLNPEVMDAGDVNNANVTTAEEAADDARMKTAEMETELHQVDQLKPDEIMVAIHMLGIEDPTVDKILPAWQDTVTEEARLLSSGLGRNHPKIKELEALKEGYTSQLDEAVSAIKATLATKVELARSTQAALESRLTQADQDYTKLKNANNNYNDAKYAYLEAKRLYEAAQQRYDTESMQEPLLPVVDTIWSKAEEAPSPTRPKVFFYMVLAVVIGLGLGCGLAFFLEYLDTSVKSLEDVERFLGVPVLAVIPKNVGVLMHQSGDSPDAEAYRILRTNIEFNRKNPDANTITLISGGPGEGKSTTLFNLAYTCAKGGYSVLVVDADLRRPSQHRFFGVENNIGLSNYLTSNMSFEEVVRSTGVENLFFIPSGQLPRDSVGILNSQRMTDLIRNTKMRYDLVMFDSPPILGVSDGAVLASEVDLSVMVIEHRRFPRSMLQRVKQAVVNVGGNLLGVVLNKVDAKHDSGYGYYGNYYDYYSTHNGEERAPTAAGAKTNGRKPQAETEHHLHGGGEQY